MVSEGQDPFLCARIDVLAEMLVMIARHLAGDAEGREAFASELQGRIEQYTDGLLKQPVGDEYLTECSEYAELIVGRIRWTPR